MDWNARVRAAFAGAAAVPEDEVVEELAQHARAVYEAARADGLSADEADLRVSRLLDEWQPAAAALHRPSRRPAAVEPPAATSSSAWAGLAQDVRYAARLLGRQPRFALVAGLTMALGIAASTILFSITYGVLMKPLPWPDADRLIVVKETRGGRAPRFGSFSNAAYLAWREQPGAIEDIGAWALRTATLAGEGDPERIRVASVTASLFTVLQVRPLVGSLFDEADETSTRGAVIVLSEGLWRRRFNADPAVVGHAIRLDGQPVTIVGVLADRLAFPDRHARAWIPMRVPPATGNILSMFAAIARLRPGATPSQAASEGTVRGRLAPDTGMTTMAIFGGNGLVQISSQLLREAVTADVRRPLWTLLAAVGLLMATATGNVVSLQLARATARRRELAIRAALGAGAARVMRQLLVENLLLGLAGGGAGLFCAWLLHRLLPSVLPADFPRGDDFGLDVAVVLFAIGVTVAASTVCGVLPAIRARRLDLVESLAVDGSAPVGASRRSPIGRTRLLIMTGQVAIASVLLVGAALLGRSFVAMLHADRGFDPSGLLTTRVSLPPSMYTPERSYVLIGQILDRLSGTPGVGHAAFTSELPLTPGGSTAAFTLRPRAEGDVPVTVQASPRIVSPNGFAALGMRVIAGRGFSDADTDASEPVAIVNRLFARRYLRDSALGARVPMRVGYGDSDTEATVVGVVDDIRYLTAADASLPEIYYSFRQFEGRVPVPGVTILVRSERDPATLVPALRSAIREADAGLVAENLMTLEDRMSTVLARPRLYAIVLGGFAAFTFVVAAVGLFGVLSYTVAQRSRELALRAALGARPRDLARLVLVQCLTVTGSGLAAGLAASALLTRSIGALLYGVAPHDAVTYLSVAAAIGVMAVAAAAAPARRAARLDPLTVLRT
jgi:predicted permease